MDSPRASLSFFLQATVSFAFVWLASAQKFNYNPQFIQSREPLGERSALFSFVRDPTVRFQHRVMTFNNDLYPPNWTGDTTSNSSVGTVQGVCFETMYAAYFECFHTLQLPGGTMTAHGPFSSQKMTRTTQVVTGASGIYANKRGEAFYFPSLNGRVLWRFKLWDFNTSTTVLPKFRPRLNYSSIRTPPGRRSSSLYSFLPTASEAQPQRVLVHYSELRNANDTKAGYVQAVCVETYYNVYYECLYTMAMSSRTSLTIQGPLNVNYVPTTPVVTGSRGRYQKYLGALTLMPEDTNFRTVWNFNLQQFIA